MQVFTIYINGNKEETWENQEDAMARFEHLRDTLRQTHTVAMVPDYLTLEETDELRKQ